MPTATRRRPSAPKTSSTAPRRKRTGRAITSFRNVVVATDGTRDADSALKFAKSLAEGTVSVHVVSVCEPIPAPADWTPLGVMTLGDTTPTPDPVRERAARLTSVRAQVKRAVGADARWPVRVTTGPIGASIAALLHEAKGDLLITGRGRHGLPERLLGEEHLLKVLRMIDVPVLAVEPGLRRRPKRVVIGVDFSEHSIDAARAGLMLADDKATVHLVHVVPDPVMEIAYPQKWIRSYEDGARRGLEEMHARLNPRATLTIEHVALSGHPAVQLAETAKRARADLIVTGAHGHGFINRLVLGSVTAYVLRAADCSVLSVPTRSA